MAIRDVAQRLVGGRAADAVGRLNDRHPWSHNDAFHPWIVTELPTLRRLAVDVGCGRGELLAVLADHFDHVHGCDTDAAMRRASMTRCAGLSNVTVSGTTLADLPAGADLVTMVAVLHHLDIDLALAEVRRILNPGGRFLCVGLARPVSLADHLWDLASMITNPIIGYVRHPWVARHPPRPDPFPVADPQLTVQQIRRTVGMVLPGAQVRRHLGFRHTIRWTRPV